MTEPKKPNFIIIGAMKAATTSLYTYIKQHPDIFMSYIKEPMFFNNLNSKKPYIIKGSSKKKFKNFEKYLSLFKKANHEQSIGEASPAYMYDQNCPTLIKKYLPNTKIIAILRQPVKRAYSNFLHARRADKEPISVFKEAFNAEEDRMSNNWGPLYHYKSQGLYYKQLARYYNLFPKNQIKIILFEDLIKNPTLTSQEIFWFLNVDATFIPNTSKKANVSGVPKGILGWIIMKLRKHNLIPNVEFSKILPSSIIRFILRNIYSEPKKISKELVKELTTKHYTEDIKKLEKLIGKNLSQWL